MFLSDNIFMCEGDVMEQRVEISLMLDLYGGLLTDKQAELMTLYYNEDLSLAEISELTNTTRQAIHDILKRCHKLLLQYEEKLHLLEKSLSEQNKKKNIDLYLKMMKDKVEDQELIDIIQKVEEIVNMDI